MNLVASMCDSTRFYTRTQKWLDTEPHGVPELSTPGFDSKSNFHESGGINVRCCEILHSNTKAAEFRATWCHRSFRRHGSIANQISMNLGASIRDSIGFYNIKHKNDPTQSHMACQKLSTAWFDSKSSSHESGCIGVRFYEIVH